MKYVIGLDVGTTSVRSALFNLESGSLEIAKAKELEQFYPKPSWVEEDAEEIFLATKLCLEEACEKIEGETLLGVSLTNMRETVVAWDKFTQKPLYNAIIWQCRRTAEYCESLSSKEKAVILDKTGLVVDAYFSASKIRWLLDNVPKVKKAFKEDRLMVGTIDSFICYRLSNGKSFVTDVTNASRTMLFNIKTLGYDDELLKIFSIPRSILPTVIDNDQIACTINVLGREVPLAGIVGDQQSALFGQDCVLRGQAKVTYGTGLFMLFNTGEECVESRGGLLSTIAYRIDNKTYYALEGSVFNAGTAIQWLRDKMGLITTASESEMLAKSIPSSEGVCFVPAFTGLGAPNWKSDATGLITGLTRGTGKAHIVRASLEAMAFATRQLFELMQEISGVKLASIKADGGASNNGFLMQTEANELETAVIVPKNSEATVFGSIKLCIKALGLQCDFTTEGDKKYSPKLKEEGAYEKWLKAMERCLL